MKLTLSPVANDTRINIADFAPKEIVKSPDDKKKSVKRRKLNVNDGGEETFLLDDSEDEA